MTPSTVLPSAYPGPGEILDDKYRVESILGEGGMGAVARATHLLLHRTVAVKFMNPMFMSFPGAVERFLNEGRASGAIRSDHVVPVSDVGCLPSGTPYLVMECLEGLDLADLLARDGPSGLPVERAVHFVLQILRGLQAAHAIGIVHRDMKPSNCFVVAHDGEGDFVKILDFGISKIAQPGSVSLTQTNSALGTPLYMSPEQARSPRDVDARSDLYSVGVILYELLSGRTPFFSESGEFTEILFQLFTTDPPPIKEARPDLPDALAEVVHKALAREASERYATALAMAEALAPFATAKSAGVVERMRLFKPAKDSILPAPDLPTSLAAFSQLQRSHGTDVMVNAPRTEVQRGSPVTEILVDNAPPPQIQRKTAVMPPTPSKRHAASPSHEAMRARPDEALGKTQFDYESNPPPTGAATGGVVSAAVTAFGAAREASSASTKRSTLVYALPALVVVALAGGTAAFAMRSGKDVTSDPASTTPVGASASMAPSASTEPAPSSEPHLTTAPASAVSDPASAAPIASEAASAGVASAIAPARTAPSRRPSTPSTSFMPGLDNGIRK